MKKLTLILFLLTFGMTVLAQNDSIPVIGENREDTTMTVKKSLPVPKVTPVDVDDNKPHMVLHYYDKHGDPLDEPVMFLATLDTVTKPKSKPIYPTYNGVNVGLNFGDLIFMAFGQKHASFDAWANVSLWNWLFPVVEMGVGYIKDTPDKMNYTYKSGPSLYAKIGLNYNFLYKSNPDYQFYLGIRAGFSSFKYDITDISITSDYWNETQDLSLKGLSSTAFYGEALAGLQVKIVSHFSLGWALRWHFMFHKTKPGQNNPMFVPGYGTSSPFSVSVSAIWTIPSGGNISTNTSQ